MPTLGDFPNGIPVPEPIECECRVCGLPIASIAERIHDGLGWSHWNCTDEFTEPDLRTEPR